MKLPVGAEKRKAGRISAKTYEINNTVQPCVLSQQPDTRTSICPHKISQSLVFQLCKVTLISRNPLVSPLPQKSNGQ